LALLGRLSWERVDGFVMQASEKPAQERSFACERRIADFAPKRPFGIVQKSITYRMKVRLAAVPPLCRLCAL
jgi:hypothetical protein